MVTSDNDSDATLSDQNNEVAPVVITDIEEVHRQAILDKQSTYIDPSTGFTVFTELSHLKRGKCCGNRCRHCPYGWSNVKTSSTEGLANASGGTKAISGDREATGRLIERILDGTYYDEDECHRSEAVQQLSNEGGTNRQHINTLNDTGTKINAHVLPPNPVAKAQAKGGAAGGALTSKNVPYTRKGDAGTSQLFTGERRDKNDSLFEAMGTVDELCSIVGVVYAELNASIEKRNQSAMTSDSDGRANNDAPYGDLPEQLFDVMSRLFDVGSQIARPAPKKQQSIESMDGNKKNIFHSHHTELLEQWIDTMTDQLPELTSFILPTGSPASAQLHVARTVCRRAERRMVCLLQEEETADPSAFAYVNRLSDYFFTAARFVNYCEDRNEVQYRREGRGLGDEEGMKDTHFQRERVVVKLKK